MNKNNQKIDDEKSQNNTPQYIYIIQASKEPSKCKIGITNDLDRRLKEYNSMTGVSKENLYEFLFSAEVLDSKKVERDLKQKFLYLREDKSREIYLYNTPLFNMYVDFIKAHKSFVCEIFIKKPPEPTTQIIQRDTPSLNDRGLDRKSILDDARRIKYDNNTLIVSKNHIPNDYDLPFAVSARQILNGVLDLGFDIVQKKQYAPIFNGKIALVEF